MKTTFFKPALFLSLALSGAFAGAASIEVSAQSLGSQTFGAKTSLVEQAGLATNTFLSGQVDSGVRALSADDSAEGAGFLSSTDFWAQSSFKSLVPALEMPSTTFGYVSSKRPCPTPAVPEASTWAMLAAGLAGLGIFKAKASK